MATDSVSLKSIVPLHDPKHARASHTNVSAIEIMIGTCASFVIQLSWPTATTYASSIHSTHNISTAKTNGSQKAALPTEIESNLIIMMHPSNNIEDDASVMSTSNYGPKKPTNNRRPLLSKFLGLSMLSGIIVYFYSNVLDEMNSAGLGGGQGQQTNMMRGMADSSNFDTTAKDDGGVVASRRMLAGQDELDHRMMEVIEATWPECVNQRMNGIHCKSFIDDEILTLFTGDDRLTRTVLYGKRAILDVFYNSIVILMNDGDHVEGRDGDGMVYYDFPWSGSGKYVSKEMDAEIPPVIATETADGKLRFEEEPVLVVGCTLTEALNGTCVGPINGGVVIDPNAQNCDIAHTNELKTRIEAATANITIPDTAGERDLPAFDCSCLTGYHCCLLIKATVREADAWNKAIQCHLNYVPTSAKSKLFDDGRGKKVKIYTNHNFVVSKIPFVEGSWEYEQ